jgi:uncharacterized protein YndB with AHSA1/START domain
MFSTMRMSCQSSTSLASMPRTVIQSVSLPATPAKLYAMYLNPDQHSAFTGGGPARITAKAGTRVEVTQANVPDRLYDTLMSGWPSRYWDPWRSFL